MLLRMPPIWLESSIGVGNWNIDIPHNQILQNQTGLPLAI